jgi:hypothetical protein
MKRKRKSYPPKPLNDTQPKTYEVRCCVRHAQTFFVQALSQQEAINRAHYLDTVVHVFDAKKVDSPHLP